jgi:thiol:disulfide interchange protein DsbD
MFGKARKASGIFFAVAGAFGLISYAQAVPPGARLSWHEDYAEARQRALAAGRPLLVDFGASWCGACGELDRHTFSDARVVRESQRFTAVRVDLSPGQDSEEKQAILRGYSQRGLPLVVLHDRSGREVTRITSFVEPLRFLELLRSVQ